MRAIHAQVKGEYGWPRMHKELLARGIRVGKERVRRLMQQHDLKARTKRKFVVTTDSRHHLPVAPDLVQRRFNPDASNQIWTGDITYLPTDEGWVYLAGVIDLHSRQLMGRKYAAAHADQSGQGCAGDDVVSPQTSGRCHFP